MIAGVKPEGPLLPPEYRLENGADTWGSWRKTAALVRHLARRHLADRYRGSSLGFLWSFLNPMFMMCIYTFLFFIIGRPSLPGNIPFAAFFLTGYLAWNFFFVASMNAASSVADGGYLIRKSYFPRIVLPLSAVASNAVNYLVSIPLLLIFNAALGVLPGSTILLLPLAIAALLLMALGVGLFIASIAPFFRDILQLMEVVFMAWFFGSPVFYHFSSIVVKLADRPWLLWLFRCNPMVGVLTSIQSVYLNQPPPWLELGISFAIGACLLTVAGWAYARLSPKFADEV
jgi:lipopolysaccharide transport system permease protein